MARMEPATGRDASGPVAPEGATAAPGHAPGWYLACFSHELRPGQTLAVTIADEPLVLFRTESGEALALERYCPHLGGSLATGKVVGETVRCPFHHWRFDRSGACTEIPKCAKIPPKARVRPYPLRERLEGVWVYVGGTTPYYELPTEDEVFGGVHHCAKLEDFGELTSPPREITQNAFDTAHGIAVHGFDFGPATNFRVRSMDTLPTIEGELSFKVFNLIHMRTRGTSSLYGPGLWLGWNKGGFYPITGVIYHAPTPVTHGKTRLRTATFVCDSPWKPWVRLLGRFYAKGTRGGELQDLAIWDQKVARERPVACAEDAYIMAYRKWYAQLERRAREADAAPAPAAPSGAEEAVR